MISRECCSRGNGLIYVRNALREIDRSRGCQRETGHTSCYTASYRVPPRSFYMRHRIAATDGWVDRREEIDRRRSAGREIARAKSAPERGPMRTVKSLIVIDARMREKRINREDPTASFNC